MHAVIENVIPELVSLWTGTYKGLSTGSESYTLPPSVWEAIGQACSESGNTIPAAFGCRVPDIHTRRHEFIAESWLLFATVLGPALLERRFTRQRYYDHFVALVGPIDKCLQLSLSEDELDVVETGFVAWVEEFDKYVLLILLRTCTKISSEYTTSIMIIVFASVHFPSTVCFTSPMTSGALALFGAIGHLSWNATAAGLSTASNLESTRTRTLTDVPGTLHNSIRSSCCTDSRTCSISATIVPSKLRQRHAVNVGPCMIMLPFFADEQ